MRCIINADSNSMNSSKHMCMLNHQACWDLVHRHGDLLRSILHTSYHIHHELFPLLFMHWLHATPSLWPDEIVIHCLVLDRLESRQIAVHQISIVLDRKEVFDDQEDGQGQAFDTVPSLLKEGSIMLGRNGAIGFGFENSSLSSCLWHDYRLQLSRLLGTSLKVYSDFFQIYTLVLLWACYEINF